MAVSFSDLYSLPTRAQIKAQVIGFAQSAGLIVTSWIFGDPSERWVEIVPRAIDAFTSVPLTQAIRGFFFDLATDPGDDGDLSADQTPRPGWLSGLGQGWYGTTRGGATYPVGFVVLTNSGSTTTLPFKPFDLTFQRSSTASDGGKPTYRNDSDPSIYVGFGGTLTLAPSASITIPVRAEQIGTYGNATSGQISVCVTQSFGALTVTNVSPVLGAARENRDLYIARCRQAATAASPNGAEDAYRYAATTGSDGSTLQRYDGTGPVNITKVFVSKDSPTGNVTIYFGPAVGIDATDVSSANADITGFVLGVITDPIGVVPDTVTIGPTVSDPHTGGPGGAAATATNISVVGTAFIKRKPGLPDSDLIAAAQAAVAVAEGDYFVTLPIGGLNQTAGAGFVYTSDLGDVVRDAYPGLFGVTLATPAGPTTTIPLGHDPTFTGSTITITVVA